MNLAARRVVDEAEGGVSDVVPGLAVSLAPVATPQPRADGSVGATYKADDPPNEAGVPTASCRPISEVGQNHRRPLSLPLSLSLSLSLSFKPLPTPRPTSGGCATIGNRGGGELRRDCVVDGSRR